MNISVRSEADSRMLVYPLIRSLYNYGSICVITNNVYMYRLMDTDTLEGGFRNVRVIVQPDNDLETALKEDEYYEGKYDFVIYDNMGVADFDVECIIITSRVSEAYLQDIIWLIGEKATVVFRFGQGYTEKKEKKPKEKKKRNGKEDEAIEITDENNDEIIADGDTVLDGTKAMEKESGINPDGTLKNKWTRVKSDAEILNEKLAEAQAVVLPFPSFEEIEKMECRWIMPKVTGKLAKLIYSIFKDYINVDERMFLGGVSKDDEGGNFISGANVR